MVKYKGISICVRMVPFAITCHYLLHSATAGTAFPKGTTKFDKFVAYNATWNDLRGKFTDDQILDAAYLLWFADEDWKSDGKICDYMKINA